MINNEIDEPYQMEQEAMAAYKTVKQDFEGGNENEISCRKRNYFGILSKIPLGSRTKLAQKSKTD